MLSDEATSDVSEAARQPLLKRRTPGEPRGLEPGVAFAGWAQLDLNQRLPPCEDGTLTELSYAPVNGPRRCQKIPRL